VTLLSSATRPDLIAPVPARRVTPETLVGMFVAATVAVMTGGYLLDAIGLAMHPALLALLAAGGAALAFIGCRESAAPPHGSLPLFVTVVVTALAYPLWLASPSLLPVTNAPDVVHHLQLIHLIQRTHRLAHDPALAPYLMEMMNYTPGGHILAASVADWLRLDALRVILPVTAAFVALKAGVIYLLALRVVPARPGAALQAAAAPVLLLLPAAYVLRSFFQFFFFAQVLSETFAVTMVLAAVNWRRTGGRGHLWIASLSGVGMFLTWPVWMGPAAAAVLTAIVFSPWSRRRRVVAAAVALGPLAVIALLYSATHTVGTSVIGTSGAVTEPSVTTLAPAFVVLGLAGAVLAIRTTVAQPVLVLMIVTALQGLAIVILDRRAGTSSLYMPFKMVYLAVLPCAVLGALALARTCDAIASRVASVVGVRDQLRHLAAVAPLAVALWLSAGHVSMKREHGLISEPSLPAGRWERTTLPAGCVDYF
jgi:hypothetical protein